MTNRPTTIRRKIITAMMLTSTTVLLLTGTALTIYEGVSFRRSLLKALDIRAQILATNATGALAFDNPEDGAELLAALKGDPNMVTAVLYDTEGRTFATYGAPPVDGLRPSRTASQRVGRTAVEVVQPVREGDRWLGSLYLKSDLKALDTRLRVFALMVLLAVAGSIVVAFVLASWLQRGIAGPVRVLAEASRAVSERRDFSVRAPVRGNDELGLLTTTFNQMLTDLQERDVALRTSEREIRKLNASLERRVDERTAQLAASNKELEAFSYSVSHDLRAPVRHIDGFADLLKRRASPVLDEKCAGYLDLIIESAKGMGCLIDDLLAFSRMGRTEMQAGDVALAELFEEARVRCARDAGDRPIEWRIGDLPHVRGDSAMLRQVVSNLLDNAVKYTRGRTPAVIEVRAEETDRETIVSVCDNGVGFQMEYAHKLFGVFQRLHRADEFEGTGIGLANVRRIIERHGGRAWAEAEPDRGARMHVALPRAAAEHGTDPLQEAA